MMVNSFIPVPVVDTQYLRNCLALQVKARPWIHCGLQGGGISPSYPLNLSHRCSFWVGAGSLMPVYPPVTSPAFFFFLSVSVAKSPGFGIFFFYAGGCPLFTISTLSLGILRGTAGVQYPSPHLPPSIASFFLPHLAFFQSWAILSQQEFIVFNIIVFNIIIIVY